METKRRTGACAGGYENRGAISRTTTSTSGHRKGPRFTAVSDPFDRQEPARRRAVEGSPLRREKKKEKKECVCVCVCEKEREREKERGGGLAAPAIEWLCQINNDLWGRCTPIHHSINIALFDRQITHRRSRLRAGFDTFYFTSNK